MGSSSDEGGVEARMSMAWVPGCRRHMCPKAPRRSLRIVVVSGGCPVQENLQCIFFKFPGVDLRTPLPLGTSLRSVCSSTLSYLHEV